MLQHEHPRRRVEVEHDLKTSLEARLLLSGTPDLGSPLWKAEPIPEDGADTAAMLVEPRGHSAEVEAVRVRVRGR